MQDTQELNKYTESFCTRMQKLKRKLSEVKFALFIHFIVWFICIVNDAYIFSKERKAPKELTIRNIHIHNEAAENPQTK